MNDVLPGRTRMQDWPLTLIELAGALGAWTGLVEAVRARRQSGKASTAAVARAAQEEKEHLQREERTQQIDTVRSEINAFRTTVEASQREMQVQVRDIARTVQERYVQRDVLDTGFQNVHRELTETRKEIGRLSARVDNVLLNRPWGARVPDTGD